MRTEKHTELTGSSPSHDRWPGCRVTAKRLCLFGLGFYAVLSVVDFVFTFALIRLSGGTAYESNPVAAAWLDRYGWSGLAVFKALVVLIFAGSVAVILCRRPQVAAGVVTLGCAVLLWVTAYSHDMIQDVRRELAERHPAFGPPPPDPLHEPFLGLFAAR